MKIVIASSMYPPEVGRPAAYIKELAEHLSRHHQISIIAYAKTRHLASDIKLASINKRLPLIIRLSSFFFALWKVSKKANLLYVQNAMSAGLPTALVSILRGLPFIVSFIGDEAWERACQRHFTKKSLRAFLENPDKGLSMKLMMAIQSFVLKRAKIILTPSSYLRNLIIDAYHLKPSRVAINYPPAETMEALPFKSLRHPHSIFAKVNSEQSVHNILDAFVKIKKLYPDTTLTITGITPELKIIKKLQPNSNFTKSIIISEKISRVENWHLLKTATVYVYDSPDDKSPFYILRSFTVGTPIITPKTKIAEEIIHNHKTGFLIQPGDDEGIFQALKQIFDDPKLHTKLVTEAEKVLKEKFSWQAHIENLETFFHSLLSIPPNKL